MKLTLFRLFVIAGLVAVIGQVMHSVNAQMYEDQIKVCNFESVCQVINIDDYMSRESSDKLQTNFNHDLDTFNDITLNELDYNEDILIHLDTECRDNFHSFCFGTAWNSLKDYLN